MSHYSALPGTPVAEGLTTTAEALSADLACLTVLLQNPSSNTVNILIGNSAAQLIELEPGQNVVVPTGGNLSNVYAKAASGTPTLNYQPYH